MQCGLGYCIGKSARFVLFALLVVLLLVLREGDQRDAQHRQPCHECSSTEAALHDLLLRRPVNRRERQIRIYCNGDVVATSNARKDPDELVLQRSPDDEPVACPC